MTQLMPSEGTQSKFYAALSISQPIVTCSGLVSKATTATGRPILDGIDCQIATGDFVALIGLNGAGKSSLLRAILGLLPLKTGTIEFGNLDDRAKLPQLATIFQGGALVPQLSALDNVLCGNLGKYSFWQTIKGWPIADSRSGLELLDKFNLADYAHQRVSQLSGGQQQRVAIARALWQSPDILLADEPTTGLDILAGRDVMDTLSRLHREGMTVVAVLHDLHLASIYARTAIVVDRGRVVYQGEASNLVDLFPQLISA
jgi:phosphonate transport system ATP-binding protein